jgi:hypothetical protein
MTIALQVKKLGYAAQKENARSQADNSNFMR